MGYELGVLYKASDSITLGAMYKSKIAMTYKNTLFASINAFNVQNDVTSGDDLEQPAEYGVGIAYKNGANTIAFDYKRTQWGDAVGYKHFGWENQDVYSLGYEHATRFWALRAGYNYAKSPIKEQDGTTYAGAVKNFFNIGGFPAIIESHYTFGAGYILSDATSIDLAIVVIAKETNSFDT